MPRHQTPIIAFSGGPLDGVQRGKHDPGRHPHYRDGHGLPVRPSELASYAVGTRTFDLYSLVSRGTAERPLFTYEWMNPTP